MLNILFIIRDLSNNMFRFGLGDELCRSITHLREKNDTFHGTTETLVLFSTSPIFPYKSALQWYNWALKSQSGKNLSTCSALGFPAVLWTSSGLSFQNMHVVNTFLDQSLSKKQQFFCQCSLVKF